MIFSNTNKFISYKMFGTRNPPFYDDLLFYSKERDVGTVINEINSNDGELVGRNYATLEDNYISSREDIMPSDNNLTGFTVCLDIENLIQTTGASAYYLAGKYKGVENNRCWAVTVTNNTTINLTSSSSGSGASALALLTTGDLINVKMILIRYDAGAVKAYVDGVEINATTSVTSIYNGDANFAIGTADGVDLSDRGSVDMYCARVWDRALTDAEMLAVRSGGHADDANIYLHFAEGGSGSIHYDMTPNEFHCDVSGSLTGYRGTNIDKLPANTELGFSKIDGVDGQVPVRLDNDGITTGVDALNGDPLTNPAISKIVSNADGYIRMPVTAGFGQLSVFDRSNSTIYTATCRNSIYYNSGNPLLWHISELNNHILTTYIESAYQQFFFVEVRLIPNTADVLSLAKILVYNRVITDPNELSEIYKFIKYNVINFAETINFSELIIF